MAVMPQINIPPAPDLYERRSDISGSLSLRSTNPDVLRQLCFSGYFTSSSPYFTPSMVAPQHYPQGSTGAEIARKSGVLDIRVTFDFLTGSSTKDDQPNVRVAEFLGAVYALDSWSKNRRYAIKHVMDYLDDLLNAGKFDECDLAFRRVEVSRLSPAVLASFLSITLAAKKRLPYRYVFYRNALEAVAKHRGMDRAIDFLSRYF